MRKFLVSAKIFFCICICFSTVNASNVYTDLIIVSSNNHFYPCNTTLLSKHNEYWRRLLENPNLKRDNKIYLPYSDQVTQIILKKIYFPYQITDIIVDINNLSFEDYLDLYKFAQNSYDNSLKDLLLAINSYKFQDDILYQLHKAAEASSSHLAEKMFEYIKNIPMNDTVYNYLIKLVREDKQHIIYSMRKNAYSPLVRYLAERNKNLLIEKKILKDNKYILDMQNWAKQEIEDNLSDYENILNYLLQNLQSSTLSIARQLNIKTPTELSSFFIAHYMANISTINFVGRLTPHAKALKKLGTYLCSSPHYANSDEIWYLASEGWLQANEAAKDSITNILSNFEVHEIKKLYSLAQLFALAYIAEPDFQEKHFKQTYEAVLIEQQTKLFSPKFNVQGIKEATENNTIWGVINEIAFATWRIEELATNPFIKSLEQIMTMIASSIDG